MTLRTHYLAAVAAIGTVAAPAAAQYAPYGYQQPYQQQAYPGYAQPAYGYGQPYGQTYGQAYAQNPVGAIIDQLLGNRYNVTDRQAVSQCATAAMAQAAAQYGGGYHGNNGYNRGYADLRVTSITDVQRRNNGLRIKGLMSSANAGQYSYDRGYANQQVSFRCNVAYNGAVTNVRISGGGNRYRG